MEEVLRLLCEAIDSLDPRLSKPSTDLAVDRMVGLSLFSLVARQSGLDNFNFLQLPLMAEQVFPNPFHFIN